MLSGLSGAESLPAMMRLTSRQATAAGWRLEHTPTGRTRVVDAEGHRYVPASQRTAELVIVPNLPGLKPLLLKRAAAPLRVRDVVAAPGEEGR